MLTLLYPSRKLCGRQRVRIYLTAQLRSQAGQSLAKLPQTDRANHHQIHVASRPFGAAGDRAEHERDFDFRLS